MNRLFSIGFLVLCLHLPSGNFGVGVQRNAKEVHVMFLNEFNETLRVYLNNKLVNSSKFMTEPSTGACLNGFKLIFLKNSANRISIKDRNDKLLFEFVIAKSTKGSYLYINRYLGNWSYRFKRDPIELEWSQVISWRYSDLPNDGTKFLKSSICANHNFKWNPDLDIISSVSG